jgi:hypothetical protein
MVKATPYDPDAVAAFLNLIKDARPAARGRFGDQSCRQPAESLNPLHLGVF